jgi:hemerythrin-like domain-containing protein
MRATDVLRKEHQLIQAMLKCLAAVTEDVAGGRPLDTASSRQMVLFFREFVDGCHHRKEEQYFFPVTEQRGVTCIPGHVSVLLAEHKEGRGYVRSMDEGLSSLDKGDRQATDRFCDSARQYARLLALHIHKEDDCLFARADLALSQTDHESILRGFEQVETREMGPGTHERLHRLAHEVCGRWSIPIPGESEPHERHGRA